MVLRAGVGAAWFFGCVVRRISCTGWAGSAIDFLLGSATEGVLCVQLHSEVTQMTYEWYEVMWRDNETMEASRSRFTNVDDKIRNDS